MKIAVFGPERRVGVIDEGSVIDISATYAKYLNDVLEIGRSTVHAAAAVPAELNAFIEEGDQAIRGARVAMEYLAKLPENAAGINGETLRFSLDEVVLHPPITGGSRIFAALANFADHMESAASNTGSSDAKATLDKLQKGGPKYFMKDARCTSGDGDPLRYPARTEFLDYEAEIAVIIGKRGRDIEANEFDEYIWGYTLSNDWSVRDNVSFGPDFMYSKNFDGAAALGPWIVVGEDIDPQNIPVECRVNGEVRQSGNTASMIHNFAALGAHLSRDITLWPGDMILSGTPKGTAVDSSTRLDDGSFPDNSKFISVGDVVEVSSSLIGSLTNEVVKDVK